MATFEEVQVGLEAQLGGEGWTIVFYEGREAAAYSTFVFSHELSGEFSYSFRTVEVEQRLLDRLLAIREFAHIRNRPPEFPNAAFIGHLRKMAGAQHWPREAFIVVARSLGAYGLIGEHEADWMEDAGPAWMADWEPLRAE